MLIDFLPSVNFLELGQNIGLLAIVVLGYSQIRSNEGRFPAFLLPVLYGLVFGLVAILSMMDSLIVGNGVRVDGRNVVLGLAAPVAGPVATVIATLMAAGYRLWLGGPTVLTGIFGLALTCAAALALTRWITRKGRPFGFRHLFLLGIIISISVQVALSMVSADLLGPNGLDARLTLAVATMLATFFLGTLLLRERDRIDVDQAHRQSEEKLAFRNMLLTIQQEMSPYAIIVIDRAQGVLSWNTRFAEMWDVDARILDNGDSWRILAAMHGMVSDPEGFVQQVRQLEAHPEREENGALITLKDGRTLERYSRGIRLPAGSVVARVWFYRDISERVGYEQTLQDARDRLEEQASDLAALAEDLDTARRDAEEAQARAVAASKAKSQFIANMSHELRTPLNAILGFSEIIRDQVFGTTETSKYSEYANDIHLAGDHLLALINDILDLAKIEADRLALNEEPVDMEGLIESCRRMIEERAQRAGLTLSSKVDPTIAGIYGDNQRLRQIVLNLITNAIKYTPSGGSVSISATVDDGGSLVIAVTDTGVGIAESDIPTVMAEFGQIDHVFNRRNVGTGLGLPLTKQLVERHGGTLKIESEVGVGTTVMISLPPARLIRRAA